MTAPNAGRILLPRRFVDVGMPRGGLRMAGKYKLIVRDEHGVAKRETDWFPNIILDSGLNRWGSGGIVTGAAIGTGTATPLATDVGLQTESHWTTTAGTGHNAISAAGSTPYNNTRTLVFRTTLGALSGNYTEVGVGWASGSNMWSRALILNGGGTPTPITVLVTEQLDIVYQLSVYPPLVDWTDTVTISGVDYDITGRAAYVNNVSGGNDGWSCGVTSNVQHGSWGSTRDCLQRGNWCGDISRQVGASEQRRRTRQMAYVNNSKQRTGYQTFSLTAGNIGGVRSAVSRWSAGQGLCAFQYEFDPVLPKDGTKTMVLNYSVDWARRP